MTDAAMLAARAEGTRPLRIGRPLDALDDQAWICGSHGEPPSLAPRQRDRRCRLIFATCADFESRAKSSSERASESFGKIRHRM